MTCILELNDAALTLYRDERVLYRAPGMAVVRERDVLFGEPALRLSRIHPRQANQQYFARLNADPLPYPGVRARNHADLVYLHLQELQPLIEAEDNALLLAVPGLLSADQLGVLLGILQEVGIEVRGFVDSAVAAATSLTTTANAYYLDVLLQRASITALEVGREVAKLGTQEVSECGLIRLLDGWVNVIADRFVRETRFDPLHAAATEQQLFNQVYDQVEQLAPRADFVVEIVQGEHNRRVELSRTLLDEKAEQRFRQLADALPAGAHVLLSERSAALPGLTRTLAGLGMSTDVLPGNALVLGCLENLERIAPAGGELRLITRLPHRAGTRAAARAPAAAAAPAAPTHALREGTARPVAALHLPVQEQDGTLVLHPADAAAPRLALNGERVTHDRVLRPGDRLVVGEVEYLLIHVEH